MVALTDRAGALLERIQVEQELPHPLRIDVEPEAGRLAMGMTDPDSDDEVLFHGETAVLYVSAPAAEMLSGCTVTAEDTPEGTRLAIAAPDEPGAGGARRNGDSPG